MKHLWLCFVYFTLFYEAHGYWDSGTTTLASVREDINAPRPSFFRWMKIESNYQRWWLYNFDWVDIERRRRLFCTAGLSIRFTCIGVGHLLNRRTILSAANLLDPYMNEQRNLRVWTLSRIGRPDTPYRYRVWKITRLMPKSLNPEHWHGPRGRHSPRHDLSVIHSLDQIYLSLYIPNRYSYPTRCFICQKRHILSNDIWMSGSGFEYLQHIYENYKIFYAMFAKKYIRDCSRYLPKWWGKFICIVNYRGFAGLSNGAGLYDGLNIVGIGSFEIRYNEERIYAFTDIRYYYDNIHWAAFIYVGEYYEYAYPHYFTGYGYIWDSSYNQNNYIPAWAIQYDRYPLGKKK